jgi:hypothetical protein
MIIVGGRHVAQLGTPADVAHLILTTPTPLRS